MKIGQISYVYAPYVGGLETYVHQLKQSCIILGEEFGGDKSE
jgi:hypothetical protein